MTVYTVGPGKTYATVNLAVAALPGGTFTSPQEIDVYWQSGGYDETPGVVLSGITPTLANPLIIKGMQPFTGAPGSQSLIFDSTNNSTIRIAGNVNYVQLVNLEIDGGTETAIVTATGASAGANLITVDSCYVHNGSSGGFPTITLGWPNQNFKMVNSIVYNSGTDRPFDARGLASLVVDYCFFVCTGTDFVVIADSAAVFTDTYAGGLSTAFYTGGGATGTNNASSDTSATTLFTNSIASLAVSSAITNAPTDWTLLAGANALVDAGVAVGGITTDIIGTSRPQGSAPDIGPWERLAGGTDVTLVAAAGTGAIEALVSSLGINMSAITSAAAAAAFGKTITSNVPLTSVAATARARNFRVTGPPAGGASRRSGLLSLMRGLGHP